MRGVFQQPVKFEPYGIAITRRQGRLCGVNPVWYLDMTPGHDWLTNPMNALIDAAIQTGNFGLRSVAKLAPFIEQMGAGVRDADEQPYRKEFWWEREWRHSGHFRLPNTFIVLCPNEDRREIERVLEREGAFAPNVSFVDPAWSLEMIIGSLAGFSVNELRPF